MNRRSSIALSFLALIVIGAILLSMPFARNAGTFGNFLSSAFTACSAVCVTGLTIVDIGAEYTRAGQLILIALVELGCLGLMTFGTFLMITIGRRLSLSNEFSLMNAYGVAQVQGLRGLICWVIGSMAVVQGLGAVALHYGYFHDWYTSAFYSVMSFCNAGFSLRPDSLASFLGAPQAILIMALETILGGIGFLVIYNLCTFWCMRRPSGARGRLSLHTKVVLRLTFYLLIFAFVAVLALEWNGAFAGLPPMEKLTAGFYQAVTPRTCGFTVVPTESLHPLTRLIYEVLMFIGGAPGSAAAGIKVTTLAVLFYTLIALCRSEQETVISHRVISYDTVRESLVIFFAFSFLIVTIIGALLVTERGGALTGEALFFEAISAITTTGLSIGDTTARLSVHGKLVVMVAMFLGRLGALTVVMMIGDREVKSHVRYPGEELVVG